ncbi:antibiotic biosynthesis monooxygenase family protein [Brevibacterium otitidis]|uniref:Antibiotic biosynthesis monooxygenase family protein n=1 Tax=Brevibacterium otitidis TaxID=53364 RepID=A0ABV5X4G5_9MICO|nr:hypothetical protein GCM10023233_23460 [Brevibacterium otitidis]
MRTTDFSATPPQGRAGSVFLGCNEYRSPWAMVEQLRRWPKLARALKRAPGYLWHRSYYEFPKRIGLIVVFESQDDLMRFARTHEHHEIMHWLVGRGDESPARGGFIRILTAEEWGYTNGIFRAEDGRTGMIDRFTQLAGETDAEAPPTSGTGRASGAGR